MIINLFRSNLFHTGNDNVWKEVFEDPAMLVGLEGVDWKQLEQLFALAPKKNIRKDLANTKSTLQVGNANNKINPGSLPI